MVELLPLDVVVWLVKPEMTDSSDGLGKLLKLTAGRCEEPRFCLTERRATLASSVTRRRCLRSYSSLKDVPESLRCRSAF